MESVELESEDKSAITGPPGEPPGEPLGGAGALESAELASEDKSATTGVVKAETAAAGDLVLWAGVAEEEEREVAGRRCGDSGL